MYRSSRDTSRWFDNDHKGTWQDKDNCAKIGPGMYQTHNTGSQVATTQASVATHKNLSNTSSANVGVLTDKQRKVSWNIGSVPFGSGSLRDLNPVKSFQTPGPNHYEVLEVVGAKPVPMKGEVSTSPLRSQLLKQ